MTVGQAANNYPQHNYVRGLAELIGMGLLSDLPKGINRLTVVHSDDCGIFAGGLCDCEPEYRLSRELEVAQVPSGVGG
jgi:hypothetical protein